MGVTVDVIPLLAGESPETAIARTYAGGMMISLDVEELEGTIEEIDDKVEPAPRGAFDGWRAEVLRRLFEVFPGWSSGESDGFEVLWAPGYPWQIEFNADGITLRARRVDPRADGPTDNEVLGAFAGLRTIIHWPDDYEEFGDLDDPDSFGWMIG